MSQPHREPDPGPAVGMPAWVKVFGALALVLVIVFVALHLTGHAPMGHGGG